MSGIPDSARPDTNAAPRPLPPRPSLEFERKRAKALLRERPDAQLAGIQFEIAKEYGFASWPKLVAYFTTAELHQRSQPRRATYDPAHYTGAVQQALTAHQNSRWWIAAPLAAYVPRCFARTDEEIFALPITPADAELMVARRNGFSSWEVLMQAAANVRREEGDEFRESPLGRAQDAFTVADYSGVRALIAKHPELLRPAESGLAEGGSVVTMAVWHERATRTAAAKELTEWLAELGCDVQSAWNGALVGGMHATRADFEFLIERGADPRWIPPNGVSLLEHVLLRSWNPGPADVLARYVTPRRAFWIAAGMNDVVAMKRYFRRDGSLTDAARNDRPDFTAVRFPVVSRPEADDRDVMWEASLVAGLNHRWAALDLLYQRGLPIDYSPWRFNLLHWAVGNRVVPVVEFLVGRGADVNLRGWQPEASAREMAAENLANMPDDERSRQVFAIVNRTS